MGNLSELYGEDFNTQRDDAATGFDAIPAGWYPVEIDGAEIKDTKAGTGKLLHFGMTIMGDKFAGRKLFSRINLINPNKKAEEIGQRELAGLGQACGLMTLTDTDDLLGKQIQVRVVVRLEDGRDPDNEIKAYKPLDGAQAPAPAARAPATRQTPLAAPRQQAPAATARPAGKRPWEKQ